MFDKMGQLKFNFQQITENINEREDNRDMSDEDYEVFSIRSISRKFNHCDSQKSLNHPFIGMCSSANEMKFGSERLSVILQDLENQGLNEI